MGFFHFLFFLLSGMIRTASDWVIFVYDAVMMQQNFFQGEMQNAVYHIQGRSSARQKLLTCKVYICAIKSQDILLLASRLLLPLLFLFKGENVFFFSY